MAVFSPDSFGRMQKGQWRVIFFWEESGREGAASEEGGQ